MLYSLPSHTRAFSFNKIIPNIYKKIVTVILDVARILEVKLLFNIYREGLGWGWRSNRAV